MYHNYINNQLNFTKMHKKEFKKTLREKGYKFYQKKGEIRITHQGNVYLHSLTTMPENVQFNNQGNVNLDSLTTMPENVQFNNQGNVYLHSLTTMPENVQFNNQGSVYLHSLTTMPENVQFNNQGNVDLHSLTTMPENVQFNNQGSVNLDSLTTMPENVQFNNQGSVNLDSLTTMPENVQFNNQGYVYLCSLTTMPENVQFNNQGYVYLDSLTEIILENKKYKLIYADGYSMVILSEKKKDEFVIYKTKYLKGLPIAEMPNAIIAQRGDIFAHGENIRQAIEDVNFKYLQENKDITEIINNIKEKNEVTITDYRLITGACRFGVTNFIKENSIKVEKMSINEVIKITKNHYGHETFKKYFNQ